jgi:hypothetical protein
MQNNIFASLFFHIISKLFNLYHINLFISYSGFTVVLLRHAMHNDAFQFNIIINMYEFSSYRQLLATVLWILILHQSTNFNSWISDSLYSTNIPETVIQF